MTASAAHPSVSLQGTATVVRFNWPKYVAALGLAVAAILARLVGGTPTIVAALGMVAGCGLLWSVSSVVATWWVYDHRRVYGRVSRGLSPIGSWVTVHAGFDEATPHLVASLGLPPVDVVDLSVPGRASLRRARQEDRPVVRGPIAPLPTGSASLDAVFFTFAIHEVRDRPRQEVLFAELHRVLRPGGVLVVTEHLRDAANLAVFGPGAFHFQPASTWTARAAEAGLTLVEDDRITPFVHRMVWRR